MEIKTKERNSGGRILRSIPAVVLLLIGLSGCYYDKLVYGPLGTPDTVSFSNDILPFIESSCAKTGCHAAGGLQPDLSATNAYTSLTVFGYVETDTSKADQSIIYQKLTTGSMSKYATDKDRAFLLKWIEQGAKNN
jgi:hypothetical protein